MSNEQVYTFRSKCDVCKKTALVYDIPYEKRNGLLLPKGWIHVSKRKILKVNYDCGTADVCDTCSILL